MSLRRICNLLVKATLALVMLFAVTMAPTAAEADPPGESGVVTRTDIDQFTGVFIDRAGGVIAVTGPVDFAQGCVGVGFQESTLVEVMRGNGSSSVGLRTTNDQLAVNAGDSFLLDVLFPSCDAIFDDDPTTGPVEPIAVGTANAGGSEMFNADGAFHGRFWIQGAATDDQGTVWQVHARAHLIINADGDVVREESSVNLVPRG